MAVTLLLGCVRQRDDGVSREPELRAGSFLPTAPHPESLCESKEVVLPPQRAVVREPVCAIGPCELQRFIQKLIIIRRKTLTLYTVYLQNIS